MQRALCIRISGFEAGSDPFGSKKCGFSGHCFFDVVGLASFSAFACAAGFSGAASFLVSAPSDFVDSACFESFESFEVSDESPCCFRA